MRRMLAGLVAAILGLAPFACRAEGLTLGDAAPPITVSKWVKGEKVEKFDEGKIYVVEYWATWCGPCIASIPHLTELQKQYKDVTFIGVSIWESDQGKVEPFVKEMGDKMDYRVAMDDVSEKKKDDPESRMAGKMAEGWMKAAEENGIPTAFIVGKDGRIAWIGHPINLDKPLAGVVDGKWDLAAAASKRLEDKAAQRKMMELSRKLSTLMRDKVKNAKAILELVDNAVSENPALEQGYAFVKFDILQYGDDREAASALGAKLYEQSKDSAGALNNLAWTIVDPDATLDSSKRDYKLALKAATRANELSKGESPEILDTLAVAMFETGDAAKALELQEQAVKLAKNANSSMKERLEKYRKAAKK